MREATVGGQSLEQVAVAELPFEFDGKASEYFSIWIVNVVLSILTLGIYSAWAKVRTHQYFYGNTFLDGASFRYLADPKQILKGRAVAFVLFMAYYFSGLAGPQVSAGMILFIMLLVPALLVMSMAFRLRNSAWRNVRFDFDKNFRRAYLLFTLPVLFFGVYIAASFMLMPENPEAMTPEQQQQNFPWILALFPLIITLMFPFWEYLLVRFRVNHARFGSEGFSFLGTAGSYYGMYFLLGLIMFLIGGFVAVLMTGGIAVIEGALKESGLAAFIPFVAMLFIMPLYLFMFAYLQAKRTNLIFNNVEIDGHRLRSRLQVGEMFMLYLTNTLAMVLSLGLLMPWAKIRTARYRASRTFLESRGGLDDFANTQRKQQSALGEEIGEMFDVDLGF